MRNTELKAQDILLLLKIVAWLDRSWLSLEIAKEIDLSPAEVSYSLKRLSKSGLINGDKKPVKAALLEVIVHGIKYFFPVSPGAMERGIPTAHSALPLKTKIVAEDNEQYVWADSEGKVRGQHIEPIYKTAPFAAKRDPKLYELLALVDSIRVGRAREQKLAISEFTRIVKGS